ncbi:MAG: endonuclease/exonuclease/phosphatase family protein [Acidobacteria bacterium]|nr:endonuclease/exonuclease/phosphatase family protein [Acidobacteriota bacterium]
MTLSVSEVEAVPAAERIYELIRKEIRPRFSEMAACGSTPELLVHPRYCELSDAIQTVLQTPEAGSFAGPVSAPSGPAYRILAYNLERGIRLDGQIEAFRTHPYLKTCDVALLTETDVGMARSGNRAVAQELAQKLGMYFVFVPCYLNLAKGSGVEYDVTGDNDLGLHGNAILSRYPIRRPRLVHLKNGKDKMKGREKRLGTQTAVVADIELPNLAMTVASVHLDANSTQRHRHDQMRDVLDNLKTDLPVVLGGDWNTTTYNSSHAFHSIMGFWLRVFMGVDNVINNHYLHPYNRFEKELFGLLESRGFDYKQCNRLGEYTVSYDVECLKTMKNLNEWVPRWCFPFIRWALRNHDGICPIKIDWFATRGLRCENPVIVHDLRQGRAVPLSDHDAIGVDVIAP